MGNFLGRQRLSLTKKELAQLKFVNDLKDKSDLNEIYSRFVTCYPYGYLNLNEFIEYIQTLNDDQYFDLNDLLKDLFDLFDINQDQRLNFDEFISFNQLMSNGTNEEKFKKIFEIYANNPTKLFTKQQLSDLIKNLFDLFQVNYSKSNLINVLQFIFHKNHFKHYEQIQWQIFTKEMQENHFLVKEILAFNDIEQQQMTQHQQQRSERF